MLRLGVVTELTDGIVKMATIDDVTIDDVNDDTVLQSEYPIRVELSEDQTTGIHTLEHA